MIHANDFLRGLRLSEPLLNKLDKFNSSITQREFMSLRAETLQTIPELSDSEWNEIQSTQLRIFDAGPPPMRIRDPNCLDPKERYHRRCAASYQNLAKLHIEQGDAKRADSDIQRAKFHKTQAETIKGNSHD